MSIGSITSTPNSWYQQFEAMQASQPSSGATSTSNPSASASVSNAGITASPANPLPFFVDFANDLQAMLAQTTGSATGSGAAPGTITTADTNTEDRINSTSSAGGVHHRHHHGGNDGSIQGDASQLVGEAAQTLQNTAAGAGNVAAAAGVFAGDVMQALQSYGGTAALAASGTTIA